MELLTPLCMCSGGWGSSIGAGSTSNLGGGGGTVVARRPLCGRREGCGEGVNPLPREAR